MWDEVVFLCQERCVFSYKNVLLCEENVLLCRYECAFMNSGIEERLFICAPLSVAGGNRFATPSVVYDIFVVRDVLGPISGKSIEHPILESIFSAVVATASINIKNRGIFSGPFPSVVYEYHLWSLGPFLAFIVVADRFTSR